MAFTETKTKKPFRVVTKTNLSSLQPGRVGTNGQVTGEDRETPGRGRQVGCGEGTKAYGCDGGRKWETDVIRVRKGGRVVCGGRR